MITITIDANPTHGLALVTDVNDEGTPSNTRYMPLSDAPPIDAAALDQRPTFRYATYLKQHHYVASHVVIGLQVADLADASGKRPPRDGWTRFHFGV